ncbi:alpha/beta hydrolase [Streptomyces netropsis]|uniref:Pimeloyl-ACP methyl ester carboxylesterase n=1 Tax=Streptomyces netropsis TaxID=55404 RepID=A0A7W7L8V1_STRNE|nr:alpha/beta hydrolase [Streptomyces netropsis]MBB4885206.1 pimeloyl-ACP methyl ester carboxylesterase [Streptomyces netropsis]GGR27529.1 alpha/beta hydrolase [Streptomyces netropsis]
MTYVDVNDTTLYYEDEGAGRPLLLLHGWATSGRVWGAQLPDLVRDHRVVTLDWRGCGRSARPARGNTIDGVVADLVALVGALRLDRPVVVGSSIGGVFATELGARHPELIAGVVSVDGPAYWPSTMPELLGGPVEGLRRDRAGTVAGWVSEWYAPGTHPALIDWTVRQVLDSGVYVDGQLPAFTSYDPRPLLPGLRVPVHYIHGELDTQIPLDVARTCAALTPGAEVSVIAGAGHLPHQERPAEFNAALRAALALMPSAPAAG